MALVGGNGTIFTTRKSITGGSDQVNSDGFKLNVNFTVINKILNLNTANLSELPFFSCLNNELANELNEINYCPDYIISFKSLNDTNFLILHLTHLNLKENKLYKS
jgi:hypothetical protein